MAKKVKLPKRVAGVKVPKELRKTAERTIAAVQERVLTEVKGPKGKEMIAAALALAAAGASAAVVRARAERETPPAPPIPPEPPVPPAPPVPPVPPQHAAGGASKPDGQAMADALGQVAEQVLGRLFGGKR
jgi:hypothetical protein